MDLKLVYCLVQKVGNSVDPKNLNFDLPENLPLEKSLGLPKKKMDLVYFQTCLEKEIAESVGSFPVESRLESCKVNSVQPLD